MREFLGDKDYRKLDDNVDLEKISSHTIQGKEMRELMASFDEIKKRFHQNEGDMPLDLPPPLDNHTTLDGRVDGGQIIITKYV